MTDTVPGHVETTVKQMAEMHGEHVRRATRLQKASEAATAFMGRPSAAIGILLSMAAWIGFNLIAPRLGLPQPDPPPFGYMELTVGALALSMTVLILVSQRRADVAAVHRSQLTLQLASVSEQKIAKVIELLEEQRRENPALPDRTDEQAAEMSIASDPKQVLARIIDTHEEAERIIARGEAPATDAPADVERAINED
jgi:uncharacterized membrane protein